MLTYARKQANADLVRWIQGDSSFLGMPNADLVLMTGNVAQVFLEDDDWLATLHHIHEALRPNGYVAFESRNPDAKAWESWNDEASYELKETLHGVMECWLELLSHEQGRVHFRGHNHFKDTGESLVVDSSLRFRSQKEMSQSLKEAGFTVQHLYGGWRNEPVTNKSRVMVFVAQRD